MAAEALGLSSVLVARRRGHVAVVTAVWPAPGEAGEVPLAGSVVGDAMRSGGIRTAVSGWSGAPAALGLEDGRACLVAPIVGSAAGRGALIALSDRADRSWAPHELRLMEALARLVAIEGELEEERGEAAEARGRTATLVEAGMALTRELSLEQLLERLVATAQEVLGARYVALGVLDDEGTSLASFVTAGVTAEERRAIGDLPQGRGLLGVLIRDARPLRLARIADDPRSVGFPPHHPPMESFLGVPVALRGKVFGNLYMTEKVGGPFTEQDGQLAQTLAAQAAIAIDNARRYEAERRRAAELESVQEVARAVLGTLDLGQLLPLIARRARQLIDAETVGVGLLEGHELVFRDAHGAGGLALEALRVPAEVEQLPERLRAALATEVAEVAPLEVRGELAGVLVAAGGRRPLDDDARRLLATFSSQAAIAVANARAFAAERERLAISAEVEAARARERVAAEGLKRVVEAQEAERARIARELHDEAGQVLTGLALHLRALEDHVADAEGRTRLAELRRSLNDAAAGLRDLATELRPPGLRAGGLAAALDAQVARLREVDIEVEIVLGALPPDVPEEVEVTIFRVVQEALTNVARHSGARHASVVATAHGRRLRVVVEDDGRGFDPSAPTGRLGLAGVRERVELLGGELRIESSVDAGTAVVVDLETPG
jgi:signal transduction histidine kinase